MKIWARPEQVFEQMINEQRDCDLRLQRLEVAHRQERDARRHLQRRLEKLESLLTSGGKPKAKSATNKSSEIAKSNTTSKGQLDPRRPYEDPKCGHGGCALERCDWAPIDEEEPFLCHWCKEFEETCAWHSLQAENEEEDKEKTAKEGKMDLSNQTLLKELHLAEMKATHETLKKELAKKTVESEILETYLAAQKPAQ